MRALSLNGNYTLTFSGNTVTISFNGNSVTFSTGGTWSASGTGSVRVATTTSYGSGYKCFGERMTAEEQAVYNSFLGTRWRSYNYQSPAERPSYHNYNATNPYVYKELIINADGSGESKEVKEDGEGNILEVSGDTYNEIGFNGSYVDSFEGTDWVFYMYQPGYEGESAMGKSLYDDDGDGVFDAMEAQRGTKYLKQLSSSMIPMYFL